MKKVMHIFTVSQSVMFLEGLFDKLNYSEYKCIVVCSDCENISPLLRDSNVDCYSIEMVRGINIFKDLVALFKLINLIIVEKPDIIHGHTPKAGLISMLAAFICCIKTRIFHLHGLRCTGETGFKRKIIFFMEKFSAILATNVFAVSASLKMFAVDSKLCNNEKIDVIHNGSIKGIDISEADNIYNRGSIYYKQKYNVDCSNKVIGFVGRITSDKGIYDLISAVELLENERDDFQLIICGPIEERNYKKMQTFNNFIKKSFVHYFGKVDKPLEIMMCFDMLVLPTYREGFGLVNMEANSVGVPVITTNTIGCIDSIEDGETGILVEIGNTTSLRDAIVLLLDNSNLAYVYGDNGRARVKRLYDRNIIWDKLIEKYDSMIIK